jgi:uncharacterized protein
MSAGSPLDAQDRERLEALLASLGDDDAITIDYLHGFCAALSIGPPLDEVLDWRQIAAGDKRPAELDALLDRFIAVVRGAAQARMVAPAPRTLRTGRIDHSGWCRGFIDGADVADWFDHADAEELDELLFPFEVVADALAEPQRAAYKPAQWRELVHDSTERLSDALDRLADYWRIVLAPPATIRREQPKVGRNDPCPCGSGRKFKQCHGGA